MSDRTVSITFAGPLADAGPLDVAVVFPVVEAFGDALRLMIRHQHTLVTGRRPPYPALLSASVLRLRAVDVGSYSVKLEIGEPVSLGKLDDAPWEGLNALLSGTFAGIQSSPTEVSFPLRRIAEGLPEGISSVVITGGADMPTLTLTRELFDDGPVQLETLTYSGRLEEVNWSRGTALLGTWLGTCLLVFPPTMAEKMHEAGGRLVSVIGTGERTPDGVAIIREIEAIEIAEENGRWISKIDPLEEDVHQALAIIRWEEKQDEWFYDDELDAFVDAIQNRRYKDQ